MNVIRMNPEKGAVKCPEGKLLVYGSPLLDIILSQPASDLLEKYGLDTDSSIFADEKHASLFREVEEKYGDTLKYSAGGSALNVARVVQWIVGTPGITSFCGGLGQDNHGTILRQETEKAGVYGIFHATGSLHTGICLTICTDGLRSMVSQQGAASCFTEEKLCLPGAWALVQQAAFFYTVSFSLATSPAVVFRLACHTHETGKMFCLNLSAPFLLTKYKDTLADLLPYVDCLFGNGTEADEFGRVHDVPNSEDRLAIAKALMEWPKLNAHQPRIVVITQGPMPVLLAAEGKVKEFPVPEVSVENIVDSSGAGDAFVGGFLAQLIQGKSLGECVRCGIYASSMVLQRIGCALPESCDYHKCGN